MEELNELRNSEYFEYFESKSPPGTEKYVGETSILTGYPHGDGKLMLWKSLGDVVLCYSLRGKFNAGDFVAGDIHYRCSYGTSRSTEITVSGASKNGEFVGAGRYIQDKTEFQGKLKYSNLKMSDLEFVLNNPERVEGILRSQTDDKTTIANGLFSKNGTDSILDGTVLITTGDNIVEELSGRIVNDKLRNGSYRKVIQSTGSSVEYEGVFNDLQELQEGKSVIITADGNRYTCVGTHVMSVERGLSILQRGSRTTETAERVMVDDGIFIGVDLIEGKRVLTDKADNAVSTFDGTFTNGTLRQGESETKKQNIHLVMKGKFNDGSPWDASLQGEYHGDPDVHQTVFSATFANGLINKFRIVLKKDSFAKIISEYCQGFTNSDFSDLEVHGNADFISWTRFQGSIGFDDCQSLIYVDTGHIAVSFAHLATLPLLLLIVALGFVSKEMRYPIARFCIPLFTHFTTAVKILWAYWVVSNLSQGVFGIIWRIILLPVVTFALIWCTAMLVAKVVLPFYAYVMR